MWKDDAVYSNFCDIVLDEEFVVMKNILKFIVACNVIRSGVEACGLTMQTRRLFYFFDIPRRFVV